MRVVCVCLHECQFVLELTRWFKSKEDLQSLFKRLPTKVIGNEAEVTTGFTRVYSTFMLNFFCFCFCFCFVYWDFTHSTPKIRNFFFGIHIFQEFWVWIHTPKSHIFKNSWWGQNKNYANGQNCKYILSGEIDPTKRVCMEPLTKNRTGLAFPVFILEASPH